ncbi:acyl-CoA synthetase [Rhodovulum adriaticum]|uniref:Fatty-acyl-CoA synthase n=1 Tax=Rhodovulum adriaticum TaxID=35804 RepID=A0A4R2NIL0_RHOAD|nr:acyl-CoA synthetase [Rhodovulum adriaticum]MBK1635799.1 acyl-CoA synthetase [Rhodovulum adriaticum]TCP21035.1 fatty-acyl-CoA synthase [Rhodovulum adriaticum]
MAAYATRADRDAIEAESVWHARDVPRSMYDFLTAARDSNPDGPAVSFQLMSDPGASAETLSWAELHEQVTRAANLFRRLGVRENDVVAYVLPNATETVVTLLGGAVAGIVNPINPLLEPEQIAAILRETGAKVVVTLKSFPKTDVAQKVAEAVRHAPKVDTVLEVDLLRYLGGAKRLIVPLIRPANPDRKHAHADYICFRKALMKERGDALDFPDSHEDRIAAYFHTGGTTGMPKVAQHKVSGMIYNGWLGARLLFRPDDTVICPLPMFHVFAAYPVMMSVIASGAHVVLPTPAGYRGDGVFDNFWKLVERWGVTFVITVPTAIAALMQRKVDADVSSLKYAFSGSAPLPVELYNRFEKATGITICEGYGLTEATCLVSINPPDGLKKIGSVGLPFPHTEVRILHFDNDGNFVRECETDEVGEICVSNPGVFEGSTYTEAEKNRNLFAEGRFLRTGDLGRLDADGYLFITGRAKDLIIRGGHNIDPAEIEEALSGHHDVAFVGAIGQPDSFAGELPCAYVELVDSANTTPLELLEYAKVHIHERAAIPKHIEILDELPKTAVGKVFKPDLRKRAIARVYDAALAEAGHAVRVAEVVEDRKRGLVARLIREGEVDDEAVLHLLGNFTRPWEWAD